MAIICVVKSETLIAELSSLEIELFGNTQYIFTGHDVSGKGNSVIITNHVHWTDWIACFAFAARNNMTGRIKMFVKRVIQYIPLIGYGVKSVGWLFVHRDWTRDEASIGEVLGHLKQRNAQGLPFWLLIHPEGTRFGVQKLEASRTFAENNNLPVLTKVLYPRSKGCIERIYVRSQVSVRSLKDQLNSVIDLTLAYSRKPPNFYVLFSGGLHYRPLKIHVHVREFSIAELPETDMDLRQWIYQRFQEKEKLLLFFQEHGRFPGDPLTMKYDSVRIWGRLIVWTMISSLPLGVLITWLFKAYFC